jgi:hypothetical protein
MNSSVVNVVTTTNFSRASKKRLVTIGAASVAAAMTSHLISTVSSTRYAYPWRYYTYVRSDLTDQVRSVPLNQHLSLLDCNGVEHCLPFCSFLFGCVSFSLTFVIAAWIYLSDDWLQQVTPFSFVICCSSIPPK